MQASRSDARHCWLVPSIDAFETCDDKLALARLLISKGFERHIPGIYDQDCHYPHILKPRHGQFGKGIEVIAGPGDHHDRLPTPDYFRQQLIPGRFEFVCHIIRAGRDIRFVRAYRYEMKSDNLVRGIAATPLTSVRHDPAGELPLFARMLEALDFEGTCCVNYKILGAVPLVFEINPRFGGSLVRDVGDYLETHLAILASRDN